LKEHFANIISPKNASKKKMEEDRLTMIHLEYQRRQEEDRRREAERQKAMIQAAEAEI